MLGRRPGACTSSARVAPSGRSIFHLRLKLSFPSTDPFTRRLFKWYQKEMLPPWPRGDTCVHDLAPLRVSRPLTSHILLGSSWLPRESAPSQAAPLSDGDSGSRRPSSRRTGPRVCCDRHWPPAVTPKRGPSAPSSSPTAGPSPLPPGPSAAHPFSLGRKERPAEAMHLLASK